MTSINVKGRKFKMKVSSVIPYNAEEIFQALVSVYDIYYVGIYKLLDKGFKINELFKISFLIFSIYFSSFVFI